MPKNNQTTFPPTLIPLIPVLSALPYAASLTDARNNYLFVNKAFERKYGYTLASLKDRDPSILKATHVNASKNLLQNVHAATIGGGWNGQLPNITRAGKLIHISLRTLPIFPCPGKSPNATPPDATPPAPFLLGVACNVGDEDKRDRVMLRVLFDRLIAQAAGVAGIGKTVPAADPARLAHLSKRRQEIYRLMRDGLSNKEIARALNITGATVRVVMAALRKHLGETHVPRLRHDK